MYSQSTTTAAPIVPLAVARLHSVFVKGEFMDFVLNDHHQKSGLVLLITRRMAPILDIYGLEAPTMHMTSEELLEYVDNLNTLVSDFHKKVTPKQFKYCFGNFILDRCTIATLMEILEISKECTDVGSLRGGATGAMVFGNLSEKQMARTCEELKIGRKDKFTDIGCGYGQLMCTVASLTEAKESAGIEYQDHIYQAGVVHLRFFKMLMKFFGKRHGRITIKCGDVTKEEHHSMVTSSSFIFANNIAFRDLNDQLKNIFLKCQNATQIVSTDPFFSMRNCKEGKFDTHINKKDELYKICEVKPVGTLTLTDQNSDWKTKSTSLYLLKIKGNASTVEEKLDEEMEYDEETNENIKNDTVDVVSEGNRNKKDDIGRKSKRIARRPLTVKFKAPKVQKSKRITPQKPTKIRKPEFETEVPCQKCLTKIKFSKKGGRNQFVLHAFIHSDQFAAFWDCQICGFQCGSFQRCRDHYKDHHQGIQRAGYGTQRLLQTFPKFKDHFEACFGDHMELRE
ncbi:unnamed protein product [Caenorhabditis nigoni]